MASLVRVALSVRPATAGDEEWLRGAYDVDWHGPRIVVDATTHDLLAASTLVAERDGRPIGYLVYEERADEAEILAVAAHPPGSGAGRALLEALVARMRTPVLVVTTNDNLAAMGFYQHCGFRLREVRAGAVDRSRAIKPQIPLVGANGIEMHDEVVLARSPDG